MQNEALQHFQTLKVKLQEALQKSHPYFEREIHVWTSPEITALQDALNEQVQGYISEKWFYTHLKPRQNEKLPRIDMLNMLSQFVGYEGWQDFIFQHTPEHKEEAQKEERPKEEPKGELKEEKAKKAPKPALQTRKSASWLWKGVAGLALLVTATLMVWAMTQKASDYEVQFCFQDADTQQPVTKGVEVFVLKKGETPLLQKVNQQGCVKIISQHELLTLVVKARYYQTDTIIRRVSQPKSSELVKLKKDDYALLIHLISKPGKTVKEKLQRRKQLDRMIDEEAQIFQVDESGLGVELYNKEDFIDKLSLPIRSLKALEVIETKYQNNRIILLRFIQKDN